MKIFETITASSRKRLGSVLLTLCAISGSCLAGPLTLPSVFSDQMVLQRDQKVPVWGVAAPQAGITVEFAGQSKSTTAGADGRWRVDLDPMPASAESRVFKVSASGQPPETVSFQDVLVGEVWLCSGQSNMDLPLGGTRKNRVENSEAEVAAANYPLIRLFQTPKTYAAKPLERIEAKWTLCTPETVKTFSAAAYFFARKLLEDLKVPVGMLQSAWGGTSIDAWTAPSGYEGLPSLDKQRRITLNMPALGGVALDAKKSKKERQTPSAIYNGMIDAHIPYAIRGVIWYQGERDHLDGMLYVDKTKALLNGWRKLWGYDFPFYFVQIAPFNYVGSAGEEDPSLLPIFWEAQSTIPQAIPGTAMAVISDAATPDNIHPPNKKPVGQRLALLAEAHTYGLDVESSGPVFRELEKKDGALRLKFDHARGLSTRDGKAPDWFEVAGRDGVFKPATATIEGETVIVRAPEVPEPQAVRFAWHKIAMPNLVNAAGLATSAFRAGDYPKDVPKPAASGAVQDE